MRYPVSGYRASSTGGLCNVGADGFAWNSSPFAAFEMRSSLLKFDRSSINSESNNTRAYGFPVRCVQE